MALSGVPLIRMAMGDAFDRLAPEVRAFHSIAGRASMQGRVQTEAPQTRLARWLALCLGTPRESVEGSIRFEVDACSDGETWTRHFPRHVMRSWMSLDKGHLVEKLGAARLRFSLGEEAGALVMRLRSLRFLGVPCPRWLLPSVHALETAEDGALHFQVSAALPWLGKVAAYRGYLDLPAIPCES